MIPHGVTLLIEGQAYVVTMLAAYVQGMSWLRPQTVGQETHRRGFVSGLKSTASMYLLVVLMLAVAAAYEALEVICLVPLLTSK